MLYIHFGIASRSKRITNSDEHCKVAGSGGSHTEMHKDVHPLWDCIMIMKLEMKRITNSDENCKVAEW
jgi:hypothetical protein